MARATAASALPTPGRRFTIRGGVAAALILMPSLCDCFGRVEAAREDAYKADGPDSDGLPGQMRIPAPAAEGRTDAVGELGATRDSARQQRAETADEPESDEKARVRADVQDAAPNKKEKHGGGHEGCAAVGGAADSGVPTIVVINAGEEKEGGGLDTAQGRPEIKENTTAQAGAGAEDAEGDSAGHINGEEHADGDSAVLEDLGAQVLKECGAIGTGSAETAEGLAEFVGSLASGGAEGAVKVLENFGPVGPLFKCLGMFIHFVGQVKAARGEGARLKIWAQTLIPIIRQSVPSPFPADMERSKQEELTQCTQQAVEAVEALQDAIGEVAKSKESWKRFFTAGKYIDRMAEAKKRVETAVDLIQKHAIVDTKDEVLKITAVLKGVWGSLTDMQQGVADLRPKLEAGLAEMRAEFKSVNNKLDKILDLVAHSDVQNTTLDPPLTHATIPPEVPELPAVLQTRQALLEEMKLRVLSQSQGACTTSLVGVSRGAATTAKSVTAHGMGGVGKTTAAVQLIRDLEVRAAFTKLLWVSVSQEVMCVCVFVCVCVCVHASMSISVSLSPSTSMCMCMRMCMCMHTCIYPSMYIYTYAHTHTLDHSRTRAHTRTHAHTLSYTARHLRAPARALLPAQVGKAARERGKGAGCCAGVDAGGAGCQGAAGLGRLLG